MLPLPAPGVPPVRLIRTGSRPGDGLGRRAPVLEHGQSSDSGARTSTVRAPAAEVTCGIPLGFQSGTPHAPLPFEGCHAREQSRAGQHPTGSARRRSHQPRQISWSGASGRNPPAVRNAGLGRAALARDHGRRPGSRPGAPGPGGRRRRRHCRRRRRDRALRRRGARRHRNTHGPGAAGHRKPPGPQPRRGHHRSRLGLLRRAQRQRKGHRRRQGAAEPLGRRAGVPGDGRTRLRRRDHGRHRRCAEGPHGLARVRGGGHPQTPRQSRSRRGSASTAGNPSAAGSAAS